MLATLLKILPVLTVLLTVSYPLLIWWADGRIEPRWLALLLLCAVATRLPGLKLSRAARWSSLAALILVALAVWANALLPLKLYPVLVNLAFLLVFAFSLAQPPSMIERFARMREPNLPPSAIGYTRRVTQVWCVFFVINGSIALGTALWASPAVWSLYTGVIAYALMGLLFAVEYWVRLRFKRLHDE